MSDSRDGIEIQKTLVEASMLFDPIYYSDKSGLGCPEISAEHYCKHGWQAGINPSEYFDTDYYLMTNPDVREANINPLFHYLSYGADEGRAPHRDFDTADFVQEHQGLLDFSINPAELCVQKYGSYEWRSALDSTKGLPVKVATEFSTVFREDFYSFCLMGKEPKGTPYDHFIETGQHEDRDPAPDFDMYFYRRSIANKLGLLSNPVYHYVKFGAANRFPAMDPEDIILSKSASTFARRGPKLSVCVHFHCFYVNLLYEFIRPLGEMPGLDFLIVTVVDESAKKQAETALMEHFDGVSFSVMTVPNIGRDIAPFLVGCEHIWSKFEIVCHIHTKLSPHLSWGDEWRKYLIGMTIGSRNVVNSIIDFFSENENVGSLFPRNFPMIRRYCTIEKNGNQINEMLTRISIEPEFYKTGYFAAGSFAWYRSSSLKLLIRAVNSLDLFQHEEGQFDGTMAHALERLIPASVRASGYRVHAYTFT